MRVDSAALVALSLSVLFAATDRALAQVVARVSVDSAGVEGIGHSSHPSISADGRLVAFASVASGLVPGDTNGFADVFVHDRATRVTSRVSVDSAGGQAIWGGGSPSLSADGRFVAFISISSLVPADTNLTSDVYVHDRLTGVTLRVSVSSSGTQGNADCSDSSISADGRFVAFVSEATNLVPGDTNNRSDVFVHDRLTSVTSRESVDSAGIEGSGGMSPSISDDGRFVTFASDSSTFVSGDTNGRRDIFVRDRSSGVTSRVSVDSAGVQANNQCNLPKISFDGSIVVFSSQATNLVPDDTSPWEDVFVHDRRTGTTRRVSVDSAGAPASGNCDVNSISADGSVVVFSSDARDLAPGDADRRPGIFVHDRRTGATSCVSVDLLGNQANGLSLFASLSSDGRFVVIDSAASNLVRGDTNGSHDIFVADRDLCRAGNVNAAAGLVTDVLYVNDSAGGYERTVRLLTFEPITILMAAPPAASSAAPFALFGWTTVPVPGERRFALPFAIGETCLPTPLTGGSPLPFVIWNNTGLALLGVPTRPSSPAPAIVVRLPRGLGRPANAFVQGIVRDTMAPNGLAAVTNGVAIEIR